MKILLQTTRHNISFFNFYEMDMFCDVFLINIRLWVLIKLLMWRGLYHRQNDLKPTQKLCV